LAEKKKVLMESSKKGQKCEELKNNGYLSRLPSRLVMAGVSVQTSKNELNCPDIMLLYAASTVLIGASTLKTHWESSSICQLKSSAFLG
jgi:hypothetical protein